LVVLGGSPPYAGDLLTGTGDVVTLSGNRLTHPRRIRASFFLKEVRGGYGVNVEPPLVKRSANRMTLPKSPAAEWRSEEWLREKRSRKHLNTMNRRQINRREALLRMKQFLADHPLAQPNARVIALQNALTAVIAEIDSHGTDQDTGRGLTRGGTADCRRIAGELRALMRLISDISKAVDPGEFPGLSKQLLMPGNSYVSLETRARGFLEVVAPIKAAFVDRMMTPNFDENLQRLINDFAQARDRKYSGRADQVDGTAGLADAVSRGVRLARELDAILSAAYANNPTLLAAWKSALRPNRDPDMSANIIVNADERPAGEISMGAIPDHRAPELQFSTVPIAPWTFLNPQPSTFPITPTPMPAASAQTGFASAGE
jgi:hypothetical protein